MRRLVTGVALGAGLLGGAVGTAAFAPAIATAATTGSTEAVTERVEEIKDALAALVSDGTLTQTQADEVAETLTDSGLGLHGHHGPRPGRIEPEKLAEILGMTTEELRAAADTEQTLAEIAEAQGVAKDELIDELVAAAKAELDEEVAEGELTQEEADSVSDGLTDRVTEVVDRPIGHGRGHGAGRFGRGGDRPEPDGSDGSGDSDRQEVTPTPGAEF